MEVNPFQITYKYGIQRELLSQAIYTDIDQEKPAINYHYTYDGLLRLRKVSAYEKNFSNKIRTLVTYDYDDVTGNVINKKQLLSKELTSTDYIHDVRNRLTSISTIALETFDMFEQTLLYDNQLASMEVDNALHFVSSGYSYNGNIRAVQTSYHLDAVGFHDSPSNFDFPTLYGYTYDKMNRLTKADALVGDFIHNSSQISNAIKIGDEAYQFDKIGNIKRLARTIAYSSNNSPDISKDEGWVYKYNLKNQLTMLSPTTNTVSSKAYTYDLNGNLKSDNARNLNQMTYGRSTYIYKLEQDSKKINYLYDSEDMRFYKKTQLSQNANDLLEELYIYDISGKLVAIKKMPTSQAAEYSYYLNGGSKEACLSSLNGDGEINNGEITFFLEDYLGNTRISYEPVSVVISNIPYEKLKINYVADYFPYGKILREYVNTASGNPEKFLSTQHERDLESGLDYRGARFYDSDIARFLSTDPLATKYPSWSPYNFVMGNPIIFIDPDGRAVKPASKASEPYVQNYFKGYSAQVGGKQISGQRIFGLYAKATEDKGGIFEKEHQSSPIWTSSYTDEKRFQGHLKELGITKKHTDYNQIMDMWKTLSAEDIVEVMVVDPEQKATLHERGSDAKLSGTNHYSTINPGLDTDLRNGFGGGAGAMSSLFSPPAYYSNDMFGNQEHPSVNTVGAFVMFLQQQGTHTTSGFEGESQQDAFNRTMNSIIGTVSKTVNGNQ